MRVLKFSVGGDDNGERLDRFTSRVSELTRTTAQNLISSGAVRVNGSIYPKNYRLHAGDQVEVELPELRREAPAPQNIPIKILYQDEDLAVVCKPAGMVVHPASGHEDGTLVNALLYAIKDYSFPEESTRPGIVHRLDRDTSGLMVVAKNEYSQTKLRDMVKRREVKRTYLALVHGIPETALGTIEAPIGRDPANRKKMAVTADRGRHAITHFELEKSFAEAALLRVELITGRTHQIRVHLSYIGHAVVGDTEYGRRGRLEEKLGLNRQFLHAYRLSFAHPVTGELLEYEEKLPPDLKEAIELIEDL